MDQALLLAINGLRTPALDGVLGFLGNWAYLAFPLLLGAIAAKARSRAALRSLLDGWLAYLLALFVVETIVKPLVDRPRPSSVEALASSLSVLGRASSSPSFPSGTATACAAGVVWLVLRHRHEPAGQLALALAVPLGLAASLARIYAAAHWPSDILVGWLAGGATAWAVHRLTEPGAQEREAPPRRPGREEDGSRRESSAS